MTRRACAVLFPARTVTGACLPFFALLGLVASTSACASPTPSRAGTCSVPDAGTAPAGCTIARTVVRCMSARAACTCVTSATHCPGCTESNGFTCVSLCSGDEYALSCGRPATSRTEGLVHAGTPEGCTTLGFTQFGGEAACCPCNTP